MSSTREDITLPSGDRIIWLGGYDRELITRDGQRFISRGFRQWEPLDPPKPDPMPIQEALL